MVFVCNCAFCAKTHAVALFGVILLVNAVLAPWPLNFFLQFADLCGVLALHKANLGEYS